MLKRKQSKLGKPARLVSIYSPNSKYCIDIESPLGTVMHKIGPSKSAVSVMKEALGNISGKGTSEISINGKQQSLYFPRNSDLVQRHLREELGLRPDLVPSPKTAQQAFDKKRNRSQRRATDHTRTNQLTFEALRRVGVKMVRRGKDGKVIKTKKTNQPSCTKVLLCIPLHGH